MLKWGWSFWNWYFNPDFPKDKLWFDRSSPRTSRYNKHVLYVMIISVSVCILRQLPKRHLLNRIETEYISRDEVTEVSPCELEFSLREILLQTTWIISDMNFSADWATFSLIRFYRPREEDTCKSVWSSFCFIWRRWTSLINEKFMVPFKTSK